MRVLFVCTGNTCRSPLAESILRRLGIAGVTVASAGIHAWNGDRASEKSCCVAKEHGLDLSAHRARLLTADLVREADLILTMTESQRNHVAEMGLADEERIRVLGEFAGRISPVAEVSDPMIPDNMEAYRDTYEQLDDMINTILPLLERERR